MRNKSDAQLLAELSDLDERSSELRHEIGKRGRESELKTLKKYIGNYYRNTEDGKGVYCHVLSINKKYYLTGTTLYGCDNKYFSLEFNHIIFPCENNDGKNIYGHLKKISKEKWDNIIKKLQPEINKGLK